MPPADKTLAPALMSVINGEQPTATAPAAGDMTTMMQAILSMSPQEWHLYDHGRRNLQTGNYVMQPDGGVSSIYQAVVPFKGKFYNIPTVWDGRILPVREAFKRAAQQGMDKWPSYDNPTEADQRYGEMHRFIEQGAIK